MADLFQKCELNPLVGHDLGVCFDVSLLLEKGGYKMWFSWRPRKAIAYLESADGVAWPGPPRIVVDARQSRWQRLVRGPLGDVTRPAVVRQGGEYHLWYSEHRRRITMAHALSDDGVRWTRTRRHVLVPDQPWEKNAVMCPCVIYDEEERLFKMWYSGGESYEPDAIGYATSTDGVSWTKHPRNPVFVPDASCAWEKDRVTAMHVLRHGGYYYGFYIGFADGFENSCIGVARSRDGVSGWERHRGNPVLSPGAPGAWDDCNVYKPCVIVNGNRWMMWYNASRRSDRMEQIGLAVCEEFDF